MHGLQLYGPHTSVLESETIELWRSNHYLETYLHGAARVARASEHTASLSTKLRDQIERDFGRGKINLLSCTTTMELGVDLGELEATVNLNLPPGIANYQQRSGRAGRRAQAAPFSVTVARNSPYDQAVYSHFDEYLGKAAPIPIVRLDNASLFQRHQNAIILCYFLRYRIKNLERNAPTLEDFFGGKLGDMERQEFCEVRDRWIESSEGKAALGEAERLQKRFALPHGIGLAGSAMMQYFQRGLDRLLDEVAGRWNAYTAELERVDGDDAAAYGKRKHWANLRETYIKQFLVDFLSRRGLIPSYSFPVHSLSLEVVTETREDYGRFNQADIMLTRDASLGISEYAPGAEVVANGRIWTSRGLIHSSRLFMPREWYVACPTCHHVDLAVTRDSVPRECSNCGAKEKRTPRQFLVPHGFVTSYADRTGLDPGQSRRRERPADEARLLTIPREDQFEPSDHHSVRMTLLRAQAEKEEICGHLFVVNRGTFGFGYLICPLCHAAEAARKPSSAKYAHQNPMSGKTCVYSNVISPSDLVHRFDTDVILLRVSQALPQAGADDGDPRVFQDCCARTLAEAMRFAAAEQLEIQASELRASYRMRGSTLDVILYDAAAGGAGYCAELAETSVTSLLQKAERQLQCSCATACTACLCDYSNQHSWDQFLRKPVLQWLGLLNSAVQPNPYADLGATLWAHPNLRSLTEALAEQREVHLFAPRVDDGLVEVRPDEGVLGWILEQLGAGKRVFLYTGQDLGGPTEASASLREVLRHFEPWLAGGRLRIGNIEIEEAAYSRIPRVFSEAAGARAWYTLEPLTPLLSSLLPEPMYRCQEKFDNRAGAMLAATRWYSVDELKPRLPLERFAFVQGERRDLAKIFNVLTGVSVERLIVNDPFCGVHLDALRALMEFVRATVTELNTLEVRCRELHFQDKNYQSPMVLKMQLEKLVDGFASKTVAVVAPFHQRRQTHDRWLEFKIIARSGTSCTHCFDLSGGIDFLMDCNAATTIYRYEPGTRGAAGRTVKVNSNRTQAV